MSNDVFSAIADPTRRKILGLLAAGAMTVHSLAGHFPVSRPAISKHLRILYEAGLVDAQKKGRESYYHLNAEPLIEVADWLDHYQQFWNKRLRALGEFMRRKE